MEWKSKCTWSQVLHEFDLAQAHDDHAVVVLQLQWETVVQLPIKQHQAQTSRSGEFCNFDDKAFRTQLSRYEPADWQTDVEAHADGLINHIQQAMTAHIPRRQNDAKKIYVTDDVWQLRLQKLQCRQKCKAVRRRRITTTAPLCAAIRSSGIVSL